MKTKRKMSVLLFMLLVTVIGCRTTSEWPQLTGFLDGYEGMYRSSEVYDIFVIKHETKNVNDYSKFLINPVSIRFTPDAEAYHMDKKTLSEIARRFRRDIKVVLQENYEVVDGPAAGVLEIRVAITDVLEADKNGSSKGIVEAEFVDTQTKERVAAAVTSNEGMLFNEWAELLKGEFDYLNSKAKIYQVE